MTTQPIKIWFSDFYNGFDPYNNFLFNLLKSHFNLNVNPDAPDFLIYSCHGKEFLNFNCPRIYYTGENLVPDFNLCDYAIGFHFLNFGKRYLRFPNFALLRDQYEALNKTKNFTEADLKNKPYFCNFIYANAQADPARDIFFHRLSQYKKVDSPGRHLKNCDMAVGERFSEDWMYTKLEFQTRCKFSIAFENSSSPGYTTEKIMHAFLTGTIPIYWGNPLVSRDFNSEAFINCHNFANFSEVVSAIEKIDKDDDLYLKILNQPPFKDNKLPDAFSEQALIGFFEKIFTQDKESAFRRPKYGTTFKYETELRKFYEQKTKSKNTIQKLKTTIKKRWS